LHSISTTDFAEHVIKCAKRRRKKSIKSQHRASKNGTITQMARGMATVKKEQRSSKDQTPHSCSLVQDKLSSPLKQEIRAMYRLNLAKHDTVCKQLETNDLDEHQSQQHKEPISPIASSPTSQQFDRSPQKNGNCVKRKLVYLSERQSEMSPTIGAPNPPPCTPNNPGN